MSGAASAGVSLGELERRFELETAVLLDRLERQAEDLERRHVELVQTREERDQARRQAAGVAAELDELTLQLAQAREASAQAREASESVFASASWRLTRPLRWAKRVAARQ